MQRDWKTGARGLLRTHWPKLTDDDLERVDGKRKELAAVLRTRYGFSETEAEQAIAAFEKEVRFPGAVK